MKTTRIENVNRVINNMSKGMVFCSNSDAAHTDDYPEMLTAIIESVMENGIESIDPESEDFSVAAAQLDLDDPSQALAIYKTGVYTICLDVDNLNLQKPKQPTMISSSMAKTEDIVSYDSDADVAVVVFLGGRHEEAPVVYDVTGVNNVDRWIDRYMGGLSVGCNYRYKLAKRIGNVYYYQAQPKPW